MVAILAMPRLPTPMATRDPGFKREPNRDAESWCRTSPATSRIARSGNFWRTGSKRGTCMFSGYPSHAAGGLWYALPRTLEHARIFDLSDLGDRIWLLL